jgi:hypothetical protein
VSRIGIHIDKFGYLGFPKLIERVDVDSSGILPVFREPACRISVNYANNVISLGQDIHAVEIAVRERNAILSRGMLVD